jgi:hypothetical protein
MATLLAANENNHPNSTSAMTNPGPNGITPQANSPHVSATAGAKKNSDFWDC